MMLENVHMGRRCVRTWRGAHWLGLLLLTVAGSGARPLAAQYSRPSGGYSLDRVTEEVAAGIRAGLRSAEPRWDDILDLYFAPDGYDRGVPDLVVYIPEVGHARQVLLHHGDLVRDLVGQDFLYIVVFSERPVPQPLLESPLLSCSIRSIETAEDPFLTALVKALADQVSASLPEPDVEKGEDETVALTFRDVRADTMTGDPLYVAMGRVRLGRNSLNRVTISPVGGFSLDPHLSLHNMFGNADGSRFGMSLGAGFTMNVHRPRFDEGEMTGTDGYLQPSMYLFGQAYLDQPHQPVDPFSLGIAIGTNLVGGDLLDGLVLGLSVGRLDGLGLIVGANSVDWEVLDEGTTHVRSTRRWRAFVGLDFGL